MKTRMAIIIWTIGIHLCLSQGFVNLNFESPILPLTPVYFEVPIANALPGWHGYTYDIETGSVYYRDRALDAAAISLHDGVGPYSFQPIRGSYSVLLQGSSMSGVQGSASLAQTGQIPSDAQALRFAVGGGFCGYYVSFAGQLLPLFQVSSGTNYVVMAADISSYAGQIGELRFTAMPRGWLFFDSVLFTPTPIPEPCAAASLALGTVVLLWRRCKANHPF